jgi:hypothetical protein
MTVTFLVARTQISEAKPFEARDEAPGEAPGFKLIGAYGQFRFETIQGDLAP